MENETEMIDSLNDQDVDTSLEVETKSDSDTQTEDNAEVLKEQLEESKKREAQMFERLQKAKGLVRDTSGKWIKPEKSKPEIKTDGEVPLSPKDYLALTENKVTSDDFDEVVRLSKVLGKTISETLKDKTAKIILTQRAEERATAEATHTSTSFKRSSKSTTEKVLTDFNSGNLPTTEEGSAALAKAQFEQLLKGTK